MKKSEKKYWTVFELSWKTSILGKPVHVWAQFGPNLGLMINFFLDLFKVLIMLNLLAKKSEKKTTSRFRDNPIFPKLFQNSDAESDRFWVQIRILTWYMIVHHLYPLVFIIFTWISRLVRNGWVYSKIIHRIQNSDLESSENDP